MNNTSVLGCRNENKETETHRNENVKRETCGSIELGMNVEEYNVGSGGPRRGG